MKAMLFAAGLGTRLRPLTNNKPKALVELEGRPLLEWAIRKLKYHGFNQLIVNVHHFGEQIIDFLAAHHNFDIQIEISDERDLLLDTGGGLKKAEWFLSDEPFLMYNTDVITSLDLKHFFDAHLKTDALATLAVRQRTTSRYLLFNDQNILSGWRNVKTGAQRICRPHSTYHDFAFSGIHAVDPKIFSLLPEAAVFSIIDVYLQAGQQHDIQAYPHDATIWLDLGKPANLEQAKTVLTDIIVDES